MALAFTDAEKEQIELSGGKPNANWTLISYNKNEKPKRPIKKLLRAHGYYITKGSGRKFEAIMEFELIE